MEECSKSLPSFMNDWMRAFLPGHRCCIENKPHLNREEKISQADSASERLQFLARLEAHSFAGRDADFLARARIPSYSGLARANIEHAKAAQLNAFPLAEGALHGFEDGFDGLFRLCAGHSGFVYYRVHYIELNHTSLPLP
jgi:hypothetical protein